LGVLTEKTIQGIQDAMKKEIADAERFAEESPYPDASELAQDLYTIM